MTVYVLTNTSNGAGYIEGVFSSSEMASTFMEQHPYGSFVLTECVVDERLSQNRVKRTRSVPQPVQTQQVSTSV